MHPPSEKPVPPITKVLPPVPVIKVVKKKVSTTIRIISAATLVYIIGIVVCVVQCGWTRPSLFCGFRLLFFL